MHIYVQQILANVKLLYYSVEELRVIATFCHVDCLRFVGGLWYTTTYMTASMTTIMSWRFSNICTNVCGIVPYYA